MVSTLEVPIPAKENVRDGWQEQGKKAIESYKTILVGGALKYVNGNWGALLKGVVMDSDTVRLYPVFRLPLGENWYKGKCLLQEDSVHAMQPHAG
ncbi:hypothetical protein B0O99DRAFT_712003 [Bisporella sp. PMI_857]|nr:hypothetical protein B0O99DRAFT_712003 [Bisporella sp. PMI_857]